MCNLKGPENNPVYVTYSYFKRWEWERDAQGFHTAIQLMVIVIITVCAHENIQYTLRLVY